MVKQKVKKRVVAYLDYNVFVLLHEGKITTDQIKDNLGTTNVIFPYSASHVEEVKNITDHNGISRLSLVNDRLKFIDSLSKRQYIERIQLDLPYKRRSLSAFNVFETISEVRGTEGVYQTFSNLISEDQKTKYRNALQLDPKTLNNVKPQDIVLHINRKLLEFHNLSIIEMIAKSRTYYPETYKWGIESDFAGLFALLDIIGYWKDKFSKTSNVARFWDSSHCAFASFCDVLVSQDDRMRLKSEVAYSIYNIKTKIFSI